MSEPEQIGAGAARRSGDDPRFLPVLAEAVDAETARIVPAGIATPAVVATGGFVAGVLTLTLMRLLNRRGRRPLLRLARRRNGGNALREVTATRSFLVDVHVLRR